MKRSKWELRELDSNAKLDVLNRYCPYCRDELKYKKFLEFYPFADFYADSSRRKIKKCIKLVRVSGCKGKHVFIIHFIRENATSPLSVEVFEKFRKSKTVQGNIEGGGEFG